MSTPTGHSAATHTAPSSSVLEFANALWRVRRPKPFVLVIEGEVGQESTAPSDYLHDQLLLPEWREAFYKLVDATGLVVCLNVHTQHPAYRDMNTVFTQMLGGDISASIGSFISVQPLADSGKLRLLGIARATRSPDYPNIPTISETVPGYVSGGWFGIIGPAGLPREITTLLNKEINWALQQPDVRDRMKKMGLDIHTESPEFFTDLMNKDFENWGKVIKGMGFKPM